MTQSPPIPKPSNPWPVIGLVGGIGSGKSSVANMFADSGCKIIGSDEAAHAALLDAEIKAQIIAVFGMSIVNEQNNIDRGRLGSVVFSDVQKLTRLNAIVHPYVARYRDQCMEKYRHEGHLAAVVLDSPLLIESGLHAQCDAVVYVHCGDQLRFSRVQKNRGWTLDDWKKRESAQCPLDKKLEISHYVVSNEADRPHTAAQVNWVLTCITRDFQRNHRLRGTGS